MFYTPANLTSAAADFTTLSLLPSPDLARHEICFARGMRYAKIIFWSLLLLGVGVMVAVFLEAESNRFASKRAAHYSSLQRLGEMARIKFHHSQLHSAFARQAHSEGNHAAQQLFSTIAYSERVQCRTCQQAIHNLGGEYTLPITVGPDTAPTQSNISTALELKRRHRTTKGYPLILRSMASNNRYVTRIMVWCDANDTHQITLLEALSTPSTTAPPRSYHVCSTCGYIAQQELPTPLCPQCRTPAARFVRF